MRIKQTGSGRRGYGDGAAAEQLAAEFQAVGVSRQDVCECADAGISWVPVESTVFSSAAYSACESLLYLRFHSGDVYCYFDFPTEQYQEFLAADSKGKYFSHYIRNRFRYSQIHQSCHVVN